MGLVRGNSGNACRSGYSVCGSSGSSGTRSSGGCSLVACNDSSCGVVVGVGSSGSSRW